MAAHFKSKPRILAAQPTSGRVWRHSDCVVLSFLAPRFETERVAWFVNLRLKALKARDETELAMISRVLVERELWLILTQVTKTQSFQRVALWLRAFVRKIHSHRYTQ
jgi:hypothetical protein